MRRVCWWRGEEGIEGDGVMLGENGVRLEYARWW